MGVDNGTRRGPNTGFCEVERFGFEPGPEFTLETFQRYAEDFKLQYFRKNENVSHLGANTTILNGTSEPSVESIEGEYWRMVERPTEEIEVTFCRILIICFCTKLLSICCPYYMLRHLHLIFYHFQVLYGADLETGIFGSGFPSKSSQLGSASHEQYIKSGWNLNNFARLPGSLLSYESSDISGVLVPWLYIGMCFSSFCWVRTAYFPYFLACISLN